MERDFSEAKKQEFLNIVKEYGGVDPWWMVWEPLNDPSEKKLAEYLQKGDYENYYNGLFDRYDYTEKTIEDIFQVVHDLDDTYSRNFGNFIDSLNNLDAFLKKMQESLGSTLMSWDSASIRAKLAPAWKQLSRHIPTKDTLLAEAELALVTVLTKPRSKWNDADIYVISYFMVYSQNNPLKVEVFQQLYDGPKNVIFSHHTATTITSVVSYKYIRDQETWNKILEQSARIFSRDYEKYMYQLLDEVDFSDSLQNYSMLCMFDSQCEVIGKEHAVHNLSWSLNPTYAPPFFYAEKDGNGYIVYDSSTSLSPAIFDTNAFDKLDGQASDEPLYFKLDLETNISAVSMNPIVASGHDAAVVIGDFLQRKYNESKEMEYDNVSPLLNHLGCAGGFVPYVGPALSVFFAVLSDAWSVSTVYDMKRKKQVNFFDNNLGGVESDSNSIPAYQTQVSDIQLNDLQEYARVFNMIGSIIFLV